MKKEKGLYVMNTEKGAFLKTAEFDNELNFLNIIKDMQQNLLSFYHKEAIKLRPLLLSSILRLQD